MIDDVWSLPLKHLGQRLVPNVHFVERRLGVDVLSEPCREIIHNRDRMAVRYQLIHSMRRDESRPAGNHLYAGYDASFVDDGPVSRHNRAMPDKLFLWLLAIGGGRDERFKCVNEVRDAVRRYNPHLVVFDLAIFVRQDIA